MDDAALLVPEGSPHGFVYTIDVITPIVDDPVAFGRIAAANALSDVYAMGATPQVALSFAGIPGALGLEVLEGVLRGMAETAHAAGCAIVGGHTIKDTEPKAGLAVIGAVDEKRAWTHTSGSAGEVVVLTKALGTGVIAQSIKKGVATDEAVTAATASMSTLNAAGRDAGHRHGVTAATDVTGFGFLGHLHHLAEASSVTAVVDTAAVPLLPGALDAAAAGHVPGGTRRNAAYVKDHVRGSIDPALHHVLADAQTSGGLLLCVAPERADALVADLDGARVVGRLVDREDTTLRLE